MNMIKTKNAICHGENKIAYFLLIIAKGIFLVLQVGVVACILMGRGKAVSDIFPILHSAPNVVLAIIGIVILAFSLILFNRISPKNKNSGTFVKSKMCVGVYAALVFTLQIIVYKCIYFTTLWDVTLIHSAADSIAKGNTIMDWIVQGGNEWFAERYFQAYPNNIFLTVIFAGIKKIASLLGATDGYFACIIVGILLIDISIVLIVMTVKKLTGNNKLTIISLLISTFFLGFNPWLIIPYSDTYAVFFTSMIMYLYCAIKPGNNGYTSYIKWFAIVLTSMIGAYIKPTVIIGLMAIIIVELLHIKRKRIKELLIKGGILVIGVIVVSGGMRNLNNHVYKEKNPDYQMTLYHYLMLGLNEETHGAYSGADRETSWKYSDPKERKKEQLRVVRERLRNRGVWGSVRFYFEKLLIINRDGTFSWKWEGGFFDEYRGLQNRFAKKLQSFYYAEENKSLYNVFQLLWITIQVLVVVFSLFYSYKDRKKQFLAITTIGINLFLMLFEVRARYLILYIPYYIVMAMIGGSYIINMIKNKHSYAIENGE